MNLSSLKCALTALFLLGLPLAAQQKIVIKGSDTLGAKMLPQLAQVYKALGNEVDFEIAAEGSTSAFTSLLAGTADIGMSSREISESEHDSFVAKGKEAFAHEAGTDLIAVVVNERNAISSLTLQEIEGIFTREITDWSQVGGKPGAISVYTRSTASGTYTSLQELAMNKRDYGSSTQKMNSNEAIAAEVGKNPNGIGYISLAYARAEGVRTLSLGDITIENEKYPLRRKIYFYTVGTPTGEVGKFLTWATTNDTAKAIISKVGFIPPSLPETAEISTSEQ